MKKNNVAEISPEEAVKILDTGAVLVDVREQNEWIAGHAPQAVHMPMSTMNFDLIPPARTVICVCHVGGRSAAVASALDLAGFSVFNLVGGMVAWAAAGLPVVDDGNQPGSVI